MRAIDVVAAIIRRDGMVLATQRGTGDMTGGWEFPGGKVEPGETPREALAREMREELDACVRVGRLVCAVEHDYPAFHLHMDCYLCELEGERLALLEHRDARWLDASALESVAWLPADVAVVEEIRRQGIV